LIVARDSVLNELQALRDSLASGDAAPQSNGSSSDSAPAATPESEIDRALNELKQCFADVAEEAEELIDERPVASLAAAFVLGLVIGRLSGALK
jgi:ElaB/YqjD/DUF883 family membrane-anchored ribosome-binding protein